MNINEDILRIKLRDQHTQDSLSDSEVYSIAPQNKSHGRYDNSHSSNDPALKSFDDVLLRGQMSPPFHKALFSWCHISRCLLRICNTFRQYSMKKSQQTTLSFILGVVVGITLTALLFQHNILTGSSMRKSKSNPMLGNGFVYHTSSAAHDLLDRRIDGDSHSVPNIYDELNSNNHGRLQDSQLHAEMTNVNFQKRILLQNEIDVEAKVFVGVLTAEKFLSSRATAVNATWGSQVDKLAFFAERGSSLKYKIPIVNLEGVSDKEYPPQKKAFHMLKHMCENHIHEYDWFIRSDDDVYIRVAKLKQFLAQIDSDKLIYMGQPGHGVPEVREKLGLNGHNFCMGGPGVIFNRKALKMLCPHLDDCMREVVSAEEDVEIGRCVSNHLHIECTHAWETLKLFYHSYQEEYTEEKPFLGNLAENVHIDKAITLHHVKIPYIMYRIHRHFTSLVLNSSSQAISHLHDQAKAVNDLLPQAKHHIMRTAKSPPQSFKPEKLSEMVIWNSFNVESIFELSPSVPDRDITNDYLADLKQICETAIDAAIDRSSAHLTYSHLSAGYYRSDPLRGTDYLVDIFFSSKEEGKSDEVKRVHLLRPIGEYQISSSLEFQHTGTNINFFIIIPVTESDSGDFEAFMMNYYEPLILQHSPGALDVISRLTLIVSSYDDETRPSKNMKGAASPSIDDVIGWYKIKYPHASIEVPGVPHSKSVSLNLAYRRGISLASQLSHDRVGLNYAILTSSNFSLSFSLFNACMMRTSNNGRSFYEAKYPAFNQMWFYQPVPFAVYPAVTSSGKFSKDDMSRFVPSGNLGFWDLNESSTETSINLPLCSLLSNFVSLMDSRPSNEEGFDSESQFFNSLYSKSYDFNTYVLRVPDGGIVNVPVR